MTNNDIALIISVLGNILLFAMLLKSRFDASNKDRQHDMDMLRRSMYDVEERVYDRLDRMQDECKGHNTGT